MSSQVLIIDDEKDICFLISEILKDEKFDTNIALNSNEALLKFQDNKPDLVILDVWLGKSKLDGLQLLKAFKEIDRTIPVIIISGHGTVDLAVNAIKNGAYDFLEKPFNSEKLIILSKRAIENAKLINENEILRKIAAPEAPIIGISTFIKSIRSDLNKYSNSSSRILITGPIGSGKKLIAQTIHKLSKRSNALANIVDFSNIDENSLNMFFNYKDKFIKDNIFYKSHNGTLILLDIEKIPIKFQLNFLKFLENKILVDNISLDIKIISISSINLLDEIEKGNFRKDLFNRLNVIPIVIPPIKDRREDVVPLCKHYLKIFSKNDNFILSKLSISKLESYDWPGNIRQIKNYIEKTVIFNHQFDNLEKYHLNDLPSDMGEALQSSKTSQNFSLSLKKARENFEKEYLLSQIKRFNGNISKISEFTGMERTAIYRKFKSLNITISKK